MKSIIIIVMLFSITSWAQDGYDVTIGELINDEGVIPSRNGISTLLHHELPLQKKGKTHSVLWDTTHGVGSICPLGKYSNLFTLLDSNGYSIDFIGSGIESVNLSIYDVIVICLMSAQDSDYTPSEVDSLTQYINEKVGRVLLTGDCSFWKNGYINSTDSTFALNVFNWLSNTGGIVIMAEHPICTNCPNENIAPIANAFNMDIALSGLSPVDLYFTNFAFHPVFSGISELYYRYAGEISASSPSREIAWDDSDKATVAIYDAGVSGINEAFSYPATSLEVSPNPFFKQICISYQVPTSSRISLKIYNISGQPVHTLIEKKILPGRYKTYWNTEELAGGIYFARLT
ncbi:T9SS type A sorting domain-containing protein, partial [candidate division WOR-3 bacterium]|nr:T9SS type A sorting domain-containing protein [candidate division WOR-3 bacterium]